MCLLLTTFMFLAICMNNFIYIKHIQRIIKIMKINIKDMKGNMYTFDVQRTDLISTIKEKLNNSTGIPTKQQRLIFAAK